jgi:3-phytase
MTVLTVACGAAAQTPEVIATVETDPVPSSGDAADDPALWIHPTEPASSLIVGTDKDAGLGV